jgi:hypothetical protein
MSSRVRTGLLSPLLVGAVLGVGLGAAGCGDQDGTPTTSASGSASADPTPPPTPLPTLTPPTAPPSTPSDGYRKVRLTGVVSIDGNGVVLTDENGLTWSLEGEAAEDADLETGARVTVTGTAVKGSDPGPGEPVPLEVTRLDIG